MSEVHVTLRALAVLRGQDPNGFLSNRRACGDESLPGDVSQHWKTGLVARPGVHERPITCPRCLVAADGAREGRSVDVRAPEVTP